MKLWKLCLLLAIPFLCFGLIGFAIPVYLGGIHVDPLLSLIISGSLLCLLSVGVLGVMYGLYYYAYDRDREFEA